MHLAVIKKKRNVIKKKENMANSPKTIYSHTFIVGRLASSPNPEDLDKKSWIHVVGSKEKYNEISAKYYSALIDSMQEYEGQKNRPDFLKCVCQYQLPLQTIENPKGVPLSLHLYDRDYPCTICNVRLHFFPYGFVFFSIEIEDSGNELNDLTLMHSWWKDWNFNYSNFTTDEFNRLLEPLLDLLPLAEEDEESCENGGKRRKKIFTYKGTKARMYQIVKTDDTEVRDDLLYEIATFMPIGVVKHSEELPPKKRDLKPSKSYLDKMMENSSVSAFDNWKALALNDSFTVLGCGENFNPYPHESYYFPLLYMRCFFEEFFCFDRNNRYRTDIDGKIDSDVEKQLEEIQNMDRYYFYDDVSFDFLPSMLHRAIAKGMELYTDRDELMGHIKDSLDEEKRRMAEDRRRRNDTTLIAVKILASISVFISVFNLITGVWNGVNRVCLAWVTIVLSVVGVYLMFAYSKYWFPFNWTKNRKQ